MAEIGTVSVNIKVRKPPNFDLIREKLAKASHAFSVFSETISELGDLLPEQVLDIDVEGDYEDESGLAVKSVTEVKPL